MSEYYDYDGLDRLTSMKRGSENNPAYQSWGLDSVGNWLTSTTGTTTDTKTFNEANETQTTTTLVSITPSYDSAGNMTLTPKPGDETAGWTCQYDAWNRLTSASDGMTTVTYQYDGTGRRTVRIVGSTAEHYYYSGQQVVETRQGSLTSDPSSLAPHYQYVWSLRYVDSPILRDSYDANGDLLPDDRIYYTTDANHNVTAVARPAGAVIEYYSYDSYGRVTYYDDAIGQKPIQSLFGRQHAAVCGHGR